jgi:hypothetical protein
MILPFRLVSLMSSASSVGLLLLLLVELPGLLRVGFRVQGAGLG